MGINHRDLAILAVGKTYAAQDWQTLAIETGQLPPIDKVFDRVGLSTVYPVGS